jgi:hypothetical protein
VDGDHDGAVWILSLLELSITKFKFRPGVLQADELLVV